jgi:hypothetical protein
MHSELGKLLSACGPYIFGKLRLHGLVEERKIVEHWVVVIEPMVSP